MKATARKQKKIRKGQVVLLLPDSRVDLAAAGYALNYAAKIKCKLTVLFLRQQNGFETTAGLLDLGLLAEGIKKRYFEEEKRELNKEMKELKALAKEKNVSCYLVVKAGGLNRETLRLIEEVNARMVVMAGSLRLFVSRLLFGSGVNRFFRELQRPVVLI